MRVHENADIQSIQNLKTWNQFLQNLELPSEGYKQANLTSLVPASLDLWVCTYFILKIWEKQIFPMLA